MDERLKEIAEFVAFCKEKGIPVMLNVNVSFEPDRMQTGLDLGLVEERLDSIINEISSLDLSDL